VAPEQFELLSEVPTSEQRRALVLVSKVLTNLANGVKTAGSKEAWMAPLEPYLEVNIPRVQEFLDRLASPPLVLCTDTPAPSLSTSTPPGTLGRYSPSTHSGQSRASPLSTSLMRASLPGGPQLESSSLGQPSQASKDSALFLLQPLLARHIHKLGRLLTVDPSRKRSVASFVNPEKRGVLQKRGDGTLGAAYRERWCILKDKFCTFLFIAALCLLSFFFFFLEDRVFSSFSIVYYFRTPQDSQAAGAIPVFVCQFICLSTVKFNVITTQLLQLEGAQLRQASDDPCAFEIVIPYRVYHLRGKLSGCLCARLRIMWRECICMCVIRRRQKSSSCARVGSGVPEGG
jgi:hypothetical protein